MIKLVNELPVQQPQISLNPPPVNPSLSPSPANGPIKSLKTPILIIVAVFLAVAVIAVGILGRHSGPANPSGPSSSTSATSSASPTPAVKPYQLDPNKNYGNKYADGILPVGDGKYVTDAPKQGNIYACSNYARNINPSQGGASVRGPWFTNNNTSYDLNKKITVSGKVRWVASITNDINGNKRSIITYGLPNHTTGVFPIARTDPAYAYDKNPNSIKAQQFDYELTADPSSSGAPNCMGGDVGVMLTGSALFNAFDAGGRDAGAWEVQDSCSGHPQMTGEYHYHTLSSCITDISVHTVIGFALDGFAITGPKVGDNDFLTTSDLDECHGITSQINLDGRSVNSYHYVMTQDFPYSVSCFRALPAKSPGIP